MVKVVGQANMYRLFNAPFQYCNKNKDVITKMMVIPNDRNFQDFMT